MSRRSHLYPLPDASVPGVPHRELLVEPDVAEELLAYQPAAFAKSKPDGFDEAAYTVEGEAVPLEWSPPSDGLAESPPDEVPAEPGDNEE